MQQAAACNGNLLQAAGTHEWAHTHTHTYRRTDTLPLAAFGCCLVIILFDSRNQQSKEKRERERGGERGELEKCQTAVKQSAK